MGGVRVLWFPGLAGGSIQTWGTRSSQVNRNQPRQAAAALSPWVLFNLEEQRRAASLWIIAFPGLWISEPLVLSIAFQTRTCFRLPCTQIAVMWANSFDKICSFEKKHFRLTRTRTVVVGFFVGGAAGGGGSCHVQRLNGKPRSGGGGLHYVGAQTAREHISGILHGPYHQISNQQEVVFCSGL